MYIECLSLLLFHHPHPHSSLCKTAFANDQFNIKTKNTKSGNIPVRPA